MEGILLEKDTEATAALRAELEHELKNKIQCSYTSYECTQLSLDGYKYCSRHILQDKNAPFKQCTYIYGSNGKRCNLPAPRCDKKEYGYCSEHALKATLARNKQSSKYPPPNTAEVLLNSLTHYVKKPRTRNVSSSTEDGDKNILDEPVELKASRSNDPFVDLDANKIYNDRCSDVMDYCSDSESDVEPSTFFSVWHDYQADSSENESIDSDVEDPLKHANVYTAEEITLITRNKLIRLQSLYIEQYRHLQYLLKEKRRKYLYALKREKETCCNIYNQVRDNPKEQRLYKKLKALNNYHRYHGQDRILNKRFRDLRNKMTDGTTTQKTHSFSKCTFTEGGVKCGEKVIPLSKHCRKHILEDPNQVLFKPCGKMTGDVECTTPITAIFEDAMCPLHMEIPPLKSYNQTRKDSESDMDDSAEAHLQHFAQFSESVKHEFLDYNPPEIPKMDTVPSLLFEENSQSMSESTMSQNELFNTNFENGSCENDKYNNTTQVSEKLESSIKSETINSQMDDSSHESGFFQGFENQNLTESTHGSNQIFGKFEFKQETTTEPQTEINQVFSESRISESKFADESLVLNESDASQHHSTVNVEDSNLNTTDPHERLSESYGYSINESQLANETMEKFASDSITSNQPTVSNSENKDLKVPDDNILDVNKMEVIKEEPASQKSESSKENSQPKNISELNIIDNICEPKEDNIDVKVEDVEMNETVAADESIEHKKEREDVGMEIVTEEIETDEEVPVLKIENEEIEKEDNDKIEKKAMNIAEIQEQDKK